MEFIKSITDNLGAILALLAAVGGIMGYFVKAVKKLVDPLKSLSGLLKGLKESNEKQEEAIEAIQQDLDKIRGQMDTISAHTKDILSSRIMELYNINKYNKTLSIQDREELDMCYEDYKSEGGNHHIDLYYTIMLAWDVVDDPVLKQDREIAAQKIAEKSKEN